MEIACMKSIPLSVRSGRVTVLALMIITLLSPQLRSAASPHRVPRIEDHIRVDARLDEPGWSEALVLELKYEVQPGENVPAPVRTEVLLAYGESHLYAAFRAYDPDPSSIRARIRDREDLGGDDWVGLIIDTFNAERRSFDFL
ncbi:MAG TPA: hypothetical protein VLA34_06640, partial [Candidatus Krumholzibacterium sp.]|nr:hypothetical protein [Candidatus Krumholzibacterium sp.]